MRHTGSENSLTAEHLSDRCQSLRIIGPEAALILREPEDHGLAEILVSLHPAEDFSFDARRHALANLPVGSEARQRVADTAPGCSVAQGGFASVDEGFRLIGMASHFHSSRLPAIPVQLENAGFVRNAACPTLWQRKVGRTTFTVQWDEDLVSLSVSGQGRRGMKTVMRLQSRLSDIDGRSIPCTWPTYLKDQVVHIALACQVVEDHLNR